MATHSDLLDHLFRDVLELRDDDISKLKQLRYDTISRATRRLTVDKIDREFKNGDLDISIYQILLDWIFFYDAYHPSYDDIAKMDSTIFDDENMPALERAYRQKYMPETLPPAPLAHPSFTPPYPTSASLHFDTARNRTYFSDYVPMSNVWRCRLSSPNVKRNNICFVLLFVLVWVSMLTISKVGVVKDKNKLLRSNLNNSTISSIKISNIIASGNILSQTPITTNQTLDWWHDDMALKLCPSMRPTKSEPLFRRIFDLARDEINQNSNLSKASCPEKYDNISIAFHTGALWGQETYEFNSLQGNVIKPRYLTYLIIYKSGNNSILRSFLQNKKTFKKINKPNMTKLESNNCLVTAIRDPINHFLSGYNEIEFRHQNRVKKMPFGRIEISNERFEQFVIDILSCPSRTSYAQLGFPHIYSMSNVLSSPYIRKESGSLLEVHYLPTLYNLTNQWGPFIAKSCLSISEQQHNLRDMISENDVSDIGLTKVPANEHLSSKDDLRTYQNAKHVWMNGSHVSKALCAMHILDYACWTDLPDGIPPLCLELFHSYHHRGVFDNII